jgi:hypothetical protein
MLFATGNGGAPKTPTPGNAPPESLGESVVRLAVQPDGSLKPVDFFAPFNAPELDEQDLDFASGGVTGLNDKYFGTPSIPHLAVAPGKEGYVYLLNRENLGGFRQGASGADAVVDRIGPYGGVWSRPGVWPGDGGWIYIPTSYSGGRLRVYHYGISGTGQPTISLQATSADEFGFSSSAAVITSNGTASGSALVWFIWAPDHTGEGAQLRAYDPVPVEGKPVLRWSAPIGTSSKFATPGVGAGRIYVGTREGKVLAYGSPVTAPLTGPATTFPTTTVGQSSQQSATLTATTALTVTKLASSSSQFVVGTPTPALPAQLSAGQTINVPLTFMPTQTGLIGGTLTAETTQGSASFSMSGTGQSAGPQLQTNPGLVNFGGAGVGGHLTGTATFSNIGSAALTINAVKAPLAPFGASGLPAAGSTIAPGGSVTVNVTFDPTAEGTFSGELALETTGGNGSVVLNGSAGPPGVLKVTSEQNEFGEVEVGKTATKSFTLSNTGGTNVTIAKSKPPVGGAFAATTSLAEGTTLAPGASLTETVTFTPTATGPTTGVWLINGDDSTGLHEVSFAGTGVQTFGTATVGPSADYFVAERKRVNRYALASAASVTKLRVYLAPAGPAGQQLLKGVLYADASSAPGALLGVSEPLTFKSTNAAGWYDLVFPAPVKLAAGNYWIGVLTGATAGVAGFRYTAVTGSRDYNANTYAAGPSNPFGTPTTDTEQASLYALYTQTQGSPPVNLTAPTITGTAQQGQTLTEHHGSWTNEPTNYGYQWLQCDASGSSCAAITGAKGQTYSPVEGDVGHTIEVQETASNAGGSSAPVSSAATAKVVVGPPVNISPPTITGTAQQGQMLTEQHGSWTGAPSSYAYQWLRCDSAGANCAPISTATSQIYVPVVGDVGHKLTVQETASNGSAASSPASSSATAAVLPASPTNIEPPTISGTAQQGQTLTEHHGTWTNEATSYSYQWLQCEALGKGCLPISGAKAQTYTAVAGDVGHTIEVQESAGNAGGTSGPASSSATASVLPPPAPANTALPTITGTAQQGQTLTAHNGTWTNEPTSFVYQWQRCDATGAKCSPISAATVQTYTLAVADVGSTVRVAVTASNSGGNSTPTSSAQTAVVQQASTTFGKTSIGASSDQFASDRKRANRYALAAAGSLSKLSIYLAPTATAGQQLLKGVVYADSGGAPGALLGVTEQLTFKSTSSAGWYDMSFSSPLKLAAGNYWLGVITGATWGVAGYRYDSVAGSRDYNSNVYTAGPSNPFGAVTLDAEQVSLYATYAPG